ncbi:hypothetical protein ACEZDO_18435, partial [Yersinia pestis]
HNLPVSVVGVKISKTGNYTILFTVSDDPSKENTLSAYRSQGGSDHLINRSVGGFKHNAD